MIIDIKTTDHRAINHYLALGEISKCLARKLHARRREYVLRQVADGIELQKWLRNRAHAA